MLDDSISQHFFSFKKNAYAQGTIEYLIIIGVIITILLILIGLLTTSFESTASVMSSSKISNLKSLSVAVFDYVASADSNAVIVLKNNTNETISVKSILVDSVDHNFGSGVSMQPNSTHSFILNQVQTCSGNTKSYLLSIIYATPNGFELIQSVGDVTFGCLSTISLPLTNYTIETN